MKADWVLVQNKTIYMTLLRQLKKVNMYNIKKLKFCMYDNECVVMLNMLLFWSNIF